MLCAMQIDAHTDTLISEQASVILGHCGLAQLYGIAQQHQPQQVYTDSVINPLMTTNARVLCSRWNVVSSVANDL